MGGDALWEGPAHGRTQTTALTLSQPNTTCILFFFFFFLRSHWWHMEVPRLGVKLELQLPAYTTATATQDWTCLCNLHHSSRQHRILTHKARD